MRRHIKTPSQYDMRNRGYSIFDDDVMMYSRLIFTPRQNKQQTSPAIGRSTLDGCRLCGVHTAARTPCAVDQVASKVYIGIRRYKRCGTESLGNCTEHRGVLVVVHDLHEVGNFATFFLR